MSVLKKTESCRIHSDNLSIQVSLQQRQCDKQQHNTTTARKNAEKSQRHRDRNAQKWPLHFPQNVPTAVQSPDLVATPTDQDEPDTSLRAAQPLTQRSFSPPSGALQIRLQAPQPLYVIIQPPNGVFLQRFMRYYVPSTPPPHLGLVVPRCPDRIGLQKKKSATNGVPFLSFFSPPSLDNLLLPSSSSILISGCCSFLDVLFMLSYS